MSSGMIALTVVTALLVFMLMGAPVAFSLLGVGLIGYLVFVGPEALNAAFGIAFAKLTTDVFIAAPLFVLMAALLEASGVGSALFDTMYKWSGGLKGGLAMGTVAICTLIDAMSALAGTATVLMGILAYPEMRRLGYDKKIAIGCIPAGGALGPLIPPSLLMIVVAGFSGISVGKLFIGGIVPGLMCTVFFIAYIAIVCYFRPNLAPAIPRLERPSFSDKLASLRGVIAPIIIILIVLGGIYAGVFTPTEAGAIGSIGALICSFIYRKFSWKFVKQTAILTFELNAMIMWIVLGGAIFSSMTALTGVGHFINDVIVGLQLPPMGIIVMLMFIVFVMGCFVDGITITTITLTIFMPLVINLGFDPLWFALLFVVNCNLGLITPPFGVAMFYFHGLGHPDVTLVDIYRSCVPYALLMMLVMVLGMVFPQLYLWLPNTMIK